MLMRICLIVAILCSLAVGALNFVKVKEKITVIQKQREDEKTAKVTAQRDLSKTKKDLKTTPDNLNRTRQNLETTKASLDKTTSELAVQTKAAETFKADRDKFRSERDEYDAQLDVYRQIGLKPPEISALIKQSKETQRTIDGLMDENRTLGQKIVALKNDLAQYTPGEEQYIVRLPASLHGKIVAYDPKYHFVVLNVGANQGILEKGVLLVHRDGKLVARVKVYSLEKEKSVANIMPGQLGDVMEGDQVIPAYPES
jgi:hypothetical protein